MPLARVDRWVANFERRHGDTGLTVADGALVGGAEDGSTFRIRLPFGRPYDGPAQADALLAEAREPATWGVLLVRKGGFAVARVADGRVVESKVGRRHVQGRSKAGGQSQQRFARRRENQARDAFGAAADHAARILGTGVELLVTGGDRQAVAAVLRDARLRDLPDPLEDFHAVPDPRRDVLDAVVADARSVRIDVLDTTH